MPPRRWGLIRILFQFYMEENVMKAVLHPIVCLIAARSLRAVVDRAWTQNSANHITTHSNVVISLSWAVVAVIHVLIIFSDKGVLRDDLMEFTDLTGKTAIVTGANTGIGFEIAKQLTSWGARVILACRSESRTRNAISAINSMAKKRDGGSVEFRHLDLDDLESVHRFSKSLRSEKIGIHLLINNAGRFSRVYDKTKQNFERSFGINFLGHFALTYNLMPLIHKTEGRIINVSSSSWCFGRNFSAAEVDSVTNENFNALYWYSASKFANMLHSKELTQRWSNIHSYACHPGTCRTEITRYLNVFLQTLHGCFGLLLKTAQQGAQSILYVCVEDTSKLLNGGCYSNCKQVQLPEDVFSLHEAADLWTFAEKSTTAFLLPNDQFS